MASMTLLEAINRAIVHIGEPEVSAITTDNQLQIVVIDAINEAVDEVREKCHFAEWAYLHDTITTATALTTGTVAVTNGSTTVTSKDASGDSADNFTSVAAGDWLRVTGDLSSYRVASVSTGSSPDTLTLEDSYVGTTSTSAGYKVIRDEYALSQTDLDQLVLASYGDGSYGAYSVPLKIVDIHRLLQISGGDVHRDASGKPRYIAHLGVDSSDDAIIKLWPYPDSVYLIDLWHTALYSEISSASSVLFSGDAPQVALNAVVEKARWRAFMWDNDTEKALVSGGPNGTGGRYGDLVGQVRAREQRQFREDDQMSLATYRPRFGRRHGLRTESQVAYDRPGGVGRW